MRKFMQMFADMSCFALAAVLAWTVRMGPQAAAENFSSFLPYLVVSLFVGLFIFRVFRLHRHFYRFFSIYDFAHLTAAVTLAILITVAVSFALFRLEAVQRSLPLLHWAFAMAFFLALRLGGMLVGLGAELGVERAGRPLRPETRTPVLIVGFTPLTEVCLRALPLFAGGRCYVIGILDETPHRKGQRLRQTEVIGHPSDLHRVLAELEIHGVHVRKVILTIPRDRLSASSRRALDALEADQRIETMDFRTHTGGFFEQVQETAPTEPARAPNLFPVPAEVQQAARQAICRYGRLKRGLDIIAALALGLIMLPVMALAIPLIWLSMGRPFYFWQERPGKDGRVFRLYKLRTLSHGVDRHGNILADEDRQTLVGRFLRRSRLDEIPQLFNVLIGDMSFVGPRPLLPVDLPAGMPQWASLRQMVRPGLTGWAQINGGQAVSKEDKVVLDVWYLTRMSLWTDIRIVWGTLHVVAGGEKLGLANIRTAYHDLGVHTRVQGPPAARGGLPKGIVPGE